MLYHHKKFFSSVSHYEVLDVPKTASHEEIKKVFFEKSKKVYSTTLTDCCTTLMD
jgi:hypothetical protein